jgi:hypothetical protein
MGILQMMNTNSSHRYATGQKRCLLQHPTYSGVEILIAMRGYTNTIFLFVWNKIIIRHHTILLYTYCLLWPYHTVHILSAMALHILSPMAIPHCTHTGLTTLYTYYTVHTLSAVATTLYTYCLLWPYHTVHILSAVAIPHCTHTVCYGLTHTVCYGPTHTVSYGHTTLYTYCLLWPYTYCLLWPYHTVHILSAMALPY